MAGIRVVTDSASDLPAASADALGISVVPLTARFGEVELADGSLSPREFWSRCATSPVLPETAAPAPGDFERAFRNAAEGGAEGIVCPTLSAGLSATFQSATMAADAVAGSIPVRIIDTRSVSMGEGLVAMGAARVAQEGGDLDAVVAEAETLTARTKLFATLDTLENLKKGGRIGAAQALFGSLLSIKPVIEVRGGVVEAESRQRTRSKSLLYLAQKVREHGDLEHLAVMHGEAPDLEEFLDLLGDSFPRERIIVGDVGAVIGAHAGPRVLGVTFQTAR